MSRFRFDPFRRNLAVLLRNFDADPSAVEALAKTLDPSNFDLSSASIAALGRIGSSKAVKPLCSFLVRGIRGGGEGPTKVDLANIPPEIRVKAVKALEMIGDSKATATLKKLTKDSSYLVRKAASEALQNLGG